MRLWTLHPKYLDRQGLTAVWREALLAQAVLAGLTRGYRHHPQLIRFQAQADPLAAVAAYLRAIAMEAQARGYHFDATKIPALPEPPTIPETQGQLAFEWGHLRAKLALRSPARLETFRDLAVPEPHPLFTLHPGEVRDWERR